jgi:hypothetical protein
MQSAGVGFQQGGEVVEGHGDEEDAFLASRDDASKRMAWTVEEESGG